jgi:CRP-like cAMP-binding protein
MVDKAKIRSLPIFANLAESDFEDVHGAAVRRSFAAGANVFEQGNIADHFFVLLDGRLRVTQVTAEGQQIIVRIVNPGDLFGIAKALQRTDYPGTATAVSDSLVLSWPMARWSDFMGSYPSMAMSAMHTMGTRLQEAQARMRELATEEVERRVAHAVLRLGEQSGREEGGGIRIDFPVSKQDIAEMTGTTLHTVSRILTAWENAGLVVGGCQKLFLKDRNRLSLIGDGVTPGLLGG